jgi:hypothetical protein
MQRSQDPFDLHDAPIVKLAKIPPPFRDTDNPDDCLVAEVDFKWLMAGQGWWIDTTRFHCDASYAAWFIDSAMASPSSALRASAAWLLLKCEGAGASMNAADPEGVAVAGH